MKRNTVSPGADKATESDEAMDEAKAAAYLGVPKRLMGKWRYEGRGPRYMKYGQPGGRGLVRYRRSDLDAYRDTAVVEPRPPWTRDGREP